MFCFPFTGTSFLVKDRCCLWQLSCKHWLPRTAAVAGGLRHKVRLARAPQVHCKVCLLAWLHKRPAFKLLQIRKLYSALHQAGLPALFGKPLSHVKTQKV